MWRLWVTCNRYDLTAPYKRNHASNSEENSHFYWPHVSFHSLADSFCSLSLVYGWKKLACITTLISQRTFLHYLLIPVQGWCRNVISLLHFCIFATIFSGVVIYTYCPVRASDLRTTPTLVYWNLLCKYKHITDTIASAMGQSELSYKASMALIVVSGGNTEGFLRNIRGGRGYFKITMNTTKTNTSWKGGVAHEQIHVERRSHKRPILQG